MPRSRCLSLAFTITVFWCCSSPAAPKVCIVVDPDAPKLEQFAAQEMSAQLSKLFGGEAIIVAMPPAEADGIILLGSPATNPAVKQALGDAWPKLSDQGHLLKSAKLGDRPVLIVGGGSPVATLWATYELGHRLGIRYLLKSDVYPPEPVPLKLDGFEVLLEPAVKIRIWTLDPNYSPLGTSSWSLADLELLLGQVAKLKFNRLRFDTTSVVPPVWWAKRFKIDGNTAGRAAFQGASEFTNPDLVEAQTDEARHAIGLRIRTSVLARATELGVVKETAEKPRVEREWFLGANSVLPRMQSITLYSKTPQPDDDSLKTSFRVQLMPPGDLNPQAYYVSRAGFDAQLKPADAYRELFESVSSNAEVADRLVRGFEAMAKATEILPKLVPNFASPPVIGTTLVPPKEDTLVAAFRAGNPPPADFKQVKELYTQSMIEMFRSHGNCRPSSKKYLYYHCKRGEFAVEYLNCYESVCLAGEAKKAGNQDKCVELLEKAVESLYNGINSLGEVARDQSDRGLIATLNEYAYRPLVKQLEEE